MITHIHFHCWYCDKHRQAIVNNGEIICPICHHPNSVPLDDTPCIECKTSIKENKTNWGYLINVFVAQVSSGSINKTGERDETFKGHITTWKTSKRYTPNRMVRFVMPICQKCYEKDKRFQRNFYMGVVGVALLGAFFWSRHINSWISFI